MAEAWSRSAEIERLKAKKLENRDIWQVDLCLAALALSAIPVAKHTSRILMLSSL
jgi:hypothetical protein